MLAFSFNALAWIGFEFWDVATLMVGLLGLLICLLTCDFGVDVLLHLFPACLLLCLDVVYYCVGVYCVFVFLALL